MPAGLLWLIIVGPERILGPALGSKFETFVVVLPYVPFGIFLVGCCLAYYFNSARLALMGYFLGLVYGYVVLPELTGGVFPLGFLKYHNSNSKLLLSPLIPLTVLVLHFTGETGLFSNAGLTKIYLLFGELVALAVFFPLVAEEVQQLIGVVPQKRIFVGQLNVPFLSGGLAVLGYGIMWFTSGRNYYSNYLSLLFWTMLTAVLALESGTTWLRGTLPLHSSLLFVGAGTLHVVKVLNLAWGKAYRDQLTQIPGRMALDECLARLTGSYVICMIDIDEFKDFNDTYGHDAGDKVLKKVAWLIDAHTSGRAFRFRGEEFTVVYSGGTAEDVEEELEELRKTVGDSKVKVTRKSKRASKVHEKTVSISLGLADSEGNYENAEEVLNAADNALFKAKDEGRNQLAVKNS